MIGILLKVICLVVLSVVVIGGQDKHSALPRTVDLAVPEFCNSAAAWRPLVAL
jgi:hypothetical protein